MTTEGQNLLYQVFGAFTRIEYGLKALETFRIASHDFDLVIVDQSMPEMIGERLEAELRRLRSDIPIILCTGFSHDINEAKAAKLGMDAFLMKPVEGKELVAVIRRVLARRSTYNPNTHDISESC